MAGYGSGGRVEDFDSEVAVVVRAVYPLALLLCRDRAEAEAEDVVAESVVRCIDRWRSGRLDHPQAYLRRVLVNEVRSRHRKTRVASVIPLIDREIEDAASRDAYTTVESRHTIANALGSVPERQRIAVALRYFEDLPIAQVAELMGTSQGTAKSQVSRGLTRLREILATHDSKEYHDG